MPAAHCRTRRVKIIACYREGVNRILFVNGGLPVDPEHIDTDAVVQKLKTGRQVKIAAITPGLCLPPVSGLTSTLCFATFARDLKPGAGNKRKQNIKRSGGDHGRKACNSHRRGTGTGDQRGHQPRSHSRPSSRDWRSSASTTDSSGSRRVTHRRSFAWTKMRSRAYTCGAGRSCAPRATTLPRALKRWPMWSKS